MNLTEKPELVTWPETHYVFIEKVGSFQENAPAAWGKLHKLIPQIKEHNKVTGYTSLYKVEPEIYRAGVSLSSPPQNLPEGLKYTVFKGGKYSRWVLKGSFMELPDACGRVFDFIDKKDIKMRDDFSLENYITDPNTTPENENVIEILMPTL